MHQAMENLTKGLDRHPALDNAFYRAWMGGTLKLGALALFARNYGAVVRGFPDLLSALFATTADVEAKVECIKTLYSEMGYGQPSKVHWVLLDQFFTELSAKLGAPGRLSWTQLEKELPLLPGTIRILSEEKDLYGNADPRVAVGAQLAQEWQAYTMTRQLYEGARNYVHCWSNRDEFHEACEYFYAHIGAAEKEHKQESMRAVMQYAVDDASVERITHGFHRLLDLYAGFWGGLAQAISGGAVGAAA